MYNYYLIRSNVDGKLSFVATDSLSCCLPCVVVGYFSFASRLSVIELVDIVGILGSSTNEHNTDGSVDECMNFKESAYETSNSCNG